MQGIYPYLKTAYVIFLLGMTVIHFSHLFDSTYNSTIDFRNVYLGAKIWQQNENPYQDDVLKLKWNQICEEENISNDLPPGLPQNFLVYPPSAFIIYSPIALLNWRLAVWVNFFVCMLACLLTILLWNRIFNFTSFPMWWLGLLILSFKGTAAALLVGQPSFIVIALGTASIYFANKPKSYPVISGILLGLTSIKPTLMIPFVLILLYHKRWKELIIAGFISIILLISSLIFFTNNPIELLQGFTNNLAQLQEVVYFGNTSYYLHSITDMSVWVNYFFHSLISDYLLVQHFMTLLLLIIVWAWKSSIDFRYIYVIIALATLLINYHLFYDVLLLIPLIFIAYTWSLKHKIALAIFSLPLFVPVNGLLDRLPQLQSFNFAYMHLPLVLMCILILVIHQSRKSETVRIE